MRIPAGIFACIASTLEHLLERHPKFFQESLTEQSDMEQGTKSQEVKRLLCRHPEATFPLNLKHFAKGQTCTIYLFNYLSLSCQRSLKAFSGHKAFICEIIGHMSTTLSGTNPAYCATELAVPHRWQGPKS